MKKRVIFLSLLLITALHPTTPTGKTFFAQSNCPTWLDPFALDTPHRSPHTQPKSGLRSTMHIEPFYWQSSNRKKLGTYFGYTDTDTGSTHNFVRVDADQDITPLRPQDIVHDSANADDRLDATINPLSQTLTFNPHIEQYGVLIANSTQIGEQFEIHTLTPWMHLTHSMGTVASTPTTQLVEGKPKTVLDFFTGNLKQVEATSPDQQDALMYGKLSDRQTNSGLADITLIGVTRVVNDQGLRCNVGGIITLPTSSRPNAQYLFEPIMGTGGHVTIGAHINARCSLQTIKGISIHGLLNISHRVGLSAHETRSPSLNFAIDSGIDAQFTRYALAGKQHTRRLFPFINMLTHPVSVTPGSSTDCSLGLCASYRWIHARIIYRYLHTQPERVTPLVSWPNQAYGLARLDYAQTVQPEDEEADLEYYTFDTATNSSTLTGSLQEGNVNYQAAQTPSQNVHTIGMTLAGAPLKKWPHTSLAIRGHYTFTTGDSFGLAGYGLSAAFSHTF